MSLHKNTSRDQRHPSTFATPQSDLSDLVFPVTLPVRRSKRLSSNSRLASMSTLPSLGCLFTLTHARFCSPYQRPIYGSPLCFSSPSRLHALLKCYSWREVKGHLNYVIGRGGFGRVYKAHIHGVDLAVKKLRYTMMSKTAVMRSLQSERLALGLAHRNIVTTYYVNDQTDPYFTIMEYVGTRTLQHLVDEGVNTEQVKYFAHDVASALSYIHKLNIVHLDVKPSNILVTNHNLAKLGDFGCSQKLNWVEEGDSLSPTNRSDITGTVAYRAPELFKGLSPSMAADVYAYGILLWQLLSLKHPYVGKDSHMVIFAVVAHGLRPSLSCVEETDDDLVALCQRCWAADPTSRPSSQSIVDALDQLCVSHDLHIRKCLF